jgi:hypothetical protein
MRKIPRSVSAFPFCVGLFIVLVLGGCKEETKVVYSERIAILPDASGLLTKEVRTLPEGKTAIAILESAGKASREIFSVALAGGDDIRFRSTVRNDTILLFHTAPDLDKSIRTVGQPSFPVRMVHLEGAAWLTKGTEEGNPIFYAPDKWKAFLDLIRKE